MPRTLTLLMLILLVCGGLWAQSDTRYDSGLNLPFNQKSGDVNPQSGSVTLDQSVAGQHKTTLLTG